MAFVIQNTGQSYANFAAAFNALPNTFDADYTILGDAGETSSGTAFNLSGKTPGSFRLTIDLQDKTRQLYNSSSTASYVVTIGMSNVTFKNLTFKGSNYTNTTSRNVFFSTNVSNTEFKNCVFTDGYQSIGHYSIIGTQQIDGVSFDKCYFTNFTSNSLNLGTKTFTAGGYLTAADTDYQFKNISVTKCTFEDTASKGNVGTSTSKADLGIKIYSCVGLTLEGNTVNGVGTTAIDIRYCKNVVSKKWTCTDWAFNALTSKQCFYYSNCLNIQAYNNALYTSTSSYFHVQYDTCSGIKTNHQTIYSSSGGDVVYFLNCLNVQEHVGNAYYSSTGKYSFTNLTSGLTLSEIGVWDYNYYGFPGNVKVCDFGLGSLSYAIRHVGYQGTTDWVATGKDTHSIFVASGSTTAEKAEVFNKDTNPAKPYYSVLITSKLFNKINPDANNYGGSYDCRGFLKRNYYDIGAYDYDAIDETLGITPPNLTLTCNRVRGIKNFSSFNFTASATPFGGATISSYNWNFADGTTSSNQNPTGKLIAASGDLMVLCTVTDSNGYDTTLPVFITVYENGCEILGGSKNLEAYTGPTSLQNAITNAYNGAALTEDVRINMYSEEEQSLVYYTGKDSAGYKLRIKGFNKNGNKPVIASNGVGNGIWFQDGKGVTVTNFKLWNSNPCALNITGNNGLTFYQCDLKNGDQPLQLSNSYGIKFVDCNVGQATNFYRLNITGCSNITFLRCLFDSDMYPNNEFTLTPSVMCSMFNSSDINFIKTEFRGRGNWGTGFKGNNNEDIRFIGCKFQRFLGRLFWLTGGTRENPNAKRYVFKRCIFDEANLAKPSDFPLEFGTKSNTASIMFDMDYCTDFEFDNNTFLQNRRGLSTYTGAIFYGTNNTNNIKVRGNVFIYKDAVTPASTGVVQIFNITKNNLTSTKEVYSQDNVFLFEQSQTTMIYGRVGTSTYSTVAQAKAAQSNLEINSVELRQSNTLFNETTFKPVSGTNLLPSAATNQTPYDYNANKSSLNYGAVEFTETPFTASDFNLSFTGINKNPLVALTYYQSSSPSVNVPSLDRLSFYINPFLQQFCDEEQLYIYEGTIAQNNVNTLLYGDGLAFMFPYTNVNKTYSIKIQVICTLDSNVKTLTNDSYFTVTKPRPIAGFSLSDYQIFKGDKVSFLNESLYHQSQIWTITNGTTTQTFTTQNVTDLQFDNAGDYSVTLSVLNEIDSSIITYVKTLQVIDSLTIPFLKISAERNTYFKNENVKLFSDARFKNYRFVIKWLFFNSDIISNTPDLIVHSKNPVLRPNSLPQGEYDVLCIASSPEGDVENFQRRFISITNAPLYTLNKSCSLSDTFTTLGGSTRTGTRIDGTNDNVLPGTVIKLTGTTKALYLSRLKGTEENPISIVPDNVNDRFNIPSESTDSVFLTDCQYVNILGQQNRINHKYGFHIYGATDAATFGIRAMELSNRIKITGCEIHSLGFAGIQCKTEPDPNNNKTFRGAFQMEYTKIGYNYVHDTKGEGMYIGFTQWGDANGYYGAPKVPDVNGNIITRLFAHLMINTKIFRNRNVNTGWDGFQIGNGVKGTEFHDNEASNNGYLNIFGQASSLSINTGSDVLLYGNRISRGLIPQPFRRFWMFNNIVMDAGNAVYMITSSEPYWNDNLPATTGPYSGQWDGSRLYNNEELDIRIFNNTFYCNGQPLIHNNKMVAGGTAQKFVYVQNAIVCKDNNFYTIDPTVAPLPPTGQPDFKQIKIFDNGVAQGSTTHYNFRNNIIRKESTQADLQIANIFKLQAMIRPTSALTYAMNPVNYVSDIAIPFWRGKFYDIQGYRRDSVTNGYQTVGAYHFPNNLLTSSWEDVRNGLLGTSDEILQNTIVEDRELILNMDTYEVVIGDGKSKGGRNKIPNTSEAADGYFILNNVKYTVEKGIIVKQESI